MTKKQVVEWYDNLSHRERAELQVQFGEFGVSDRETKFYKWLLKEKKYKL